MSMTDLLFHVMSMIMTAVAVAWQDICAHRSIFEALASKLYETYEMATRDIGACRHHHTTLKYLLFIIARVNR